MICGNIGSSTSGLGSGTPKSAVCALDGQVDGRRDKLAVPEHLVLNASLPFAAAVCNNGDHGSAAPGS